MPKVNLQFNESPIVFGDVRDAHGKPFQDKNGKQATLLKQRKKQDKYISSIYKRLGLKETGFTEPIVWDEDVATTLVSQGCSFRGYDGLYYTENDIRNISSFPQDYIFTGKSTKFICGMSVPPVMMANVAAKVAEQCFGVKYEVPDGRTA